MVTLQVFADGKPIKAVSATAFPFRIGRSALSDLRIESAGVWEEHATVVLDREAQAFHVKAVADAVVFVNGEKATDSILRNGDLLDLGAARLMFTLAPSRQSSLVPREALAWGILGAVVIAELVLISIFR